MSRKRVIVRIARPVGLTASSEIARVFTDGAVLVVSSVAPQRHSPNEYEDNAEPGHWTERGRAVSVFNSDVAGRPRRSVPSFGMSVIRDIGELRARGYDPSSIEDAMQWNTRWEAFLASPIAPFLSHGDPQELWKHPDAPLLDLDSIARNVQELAPDAILFRFGFLPIWTSVGGNVIAYHPDTRTFYWADHECVFGDECVLVPKTYQQLPLNFENLMQAVVKFSSEDCGPFLRNLRDGVYDQEIERLD